MRFLFVLALLLVVNFSNSHAQSAYLDSLRNALTFSGSHVSSEDAEGYGLAAAFTYKGMISIGVARLNSTTVSPRDEDDEFSGSGWAGFIALTISSELKNHNLGVELVISKEIFNYEENTSSNRVDVDKIESEVLGLGINFTKRLTDSDSKAAFILQYSATIFPIVESRYIRSNSNPLTSTDAFFIWSIAPVLIIGQHPNIRITIEPSVSYTANVGANFYSYGIGSTILF